MSMIRGMKAQGMGVLTVFQKRTKSGMIGGAGGSDEVSFFCSKKNC